MTQKKRIFKTRKKKEKKKNPARHNFFFKLLKAQPIRKATTLHLFNQIKTLQSQK